MSKPKRTREIKIRLADEEHRQLLERMDGGQLAAWMRDYCLASRRPRRQKRSRVDPALVRQLAWMGNNLNQIARWVNSQGPNADALLVLIELRRIESQLRGLLDAHKVH